MLYGHDVSLSLNQNPSGLYFPPFDLRKRDVNAMAVKMRADEEKNASPSIVLGGVHYTYEIYICLMYKMR